MTDVQKKAASFVSEIDPAELATRLIERGCHMKRPLGMTGRAAWKSFEQSAADGRVPEYIVRDFEAMAFLAIEYFREVISNGQHSN